jgi:hypothetical protein
VPQFWVREEESSRTYCHPTGTRTPGSLWRGFQLVRSVHLKGDRVRETSKPSYVGWSRRRAPVRADSRRQGILQRTSKRSEYKWIEWRELPEGH